MALPNSRVRLCVSRVWTRLHVVLKVFDLASNPRPRLSVGLLRPSSSLSSRIRFTSSFLVGMMTSFLPNDLSLQTAREFQFLLSYTIQVSAHIHMPSPNTSSTVFIIRPERTQSSSFWQRTQWVIPSVYARRNRLFSFLAVMQPIIESRTSHNFLISYYFRPDSSCQPRDYAFLMPLSMLYDSVHPSAVIHLLFTPGYRVVFCYALTGHYASRRFPFFSGTMQPFILCLGTMQPFLFYLWVLCNPLFYVWVLCTPFLPGTM